MNAENHSRTVSLRCPTCGSEKFSHEGNEAPEQIVACAACGSKMTREDLLRVNAENIGMHVDEVKKEIVDDFRKQLSTALGGSKLFKIK
jgi:uncharacterized Zn finger protein